MISRRPIINRGVIAETGVIPAGMQLIRDTFPFKIIDRKNTVVEDRNGREVQVMRVTGLFQEGDRENERSKRGRRSNGVVCEP